MVTLENYEEYIVLLVDGELDAAGQKELEAFMQQHPELREELALYETTRLAPDTTVVFENKESLLRDEPGGRVMNFTGWFRYGAAAGLAILIALGVMKWAGNDTNDNIVVVDKIEQPNTPIAKSDDTAVSVPQQKEEAVIVKQEASPKKEKSVVVPVVPVQKTEVAIVKEDRKAMRVDVPERLEIGRLDELPAERTTPTRYEAAALTDQPKMQAPATVIPQKEALAWLPISEDKKEGLSMIGEAITARVDKVKEVRDNIKNTDLAVKLGKKEIFTIRF